MDWPDWSAIEMMSPVDPDEIRLPNTDMDDPPFERT